MKSVYKDDSGTSNLVKADVEAVLTGQIASHTHAGGAGDMTKAVYDSNNDGVILKAQLDPDLANTSGTNTGDQTLAGLGGIAHNLATAANDFLVASGVGVFVKKTLAEVKTILGLGSAAYTASTDYATALGADDNYVTDAEKVIIGNTSGTNTGDASGHSALAPLASPTFTGTVTLPDKTVALAKLADMATASVYYRKTAGTGVPEVNTLAQLKTDLVLVKADVGLGSVDNTADVSKAVLSATKLATARTIGGISFDGQANVVAPTWKTGITTRDINAVSGVVNVAHGLGRVPSFVRVKASLVQVGNTTEAEGSYDGTNHAGLCTIQQEGTSTAITDTIYSSTAFELGFSAATVVNPYTGANRQTATITVDATNIIFTWTKTGTVASAVANIKWECC